MLIQNNIEKAIMFKILKNTLVEFVLSVVMVLCMMVFLAMQI